MTTELTQEKVQKAIDSILHVLGDPGTTDQKLAIAAFENGDYDKVRRIAATNLDDYYCKSLGYLGSAYKLIPTTDTILAESARAAADYRYAYAKRAVYRILSPLIQNLIESERTIESSGEIYQLETLHEKYDHVANIFVNTLGEPGTEQEKDCLTLFSLSRASTELVHKTAASNLCSGFCRVLSHLKQARTHLADFDYFQLQEASHLLSEYVGEKYRANALQQLSIAIAEALND